MKIRLICTGIFLAVLGAVGRGFPADVYRASGATFTEIGVGAREIVFGRAAIVTADDATAGYWNPALLTHVSSPALTGTYRFISTKTAVGGDVISFSVAGIPLPVGKLGATFLTQKISDIYEYDATGQYLSTFDSNDYAVYVAYGFQVVGPVSLGFSFKYLHQGYSGLTGLPSDVTSVTGQGFDIGTIYRVSDNIVAGIVARSKSRIGDVETPFGVDIGFSYMRSFKVGGRPQDIVIAAALEQRQYRPLKLNLGMEYMFLELSGNQFIARLGSLNNYVEDRGSGLPFNEFSRVLSVGGGGQFLNKKMHVDFAYMLRNQLLENSSFVSMGMSF